MTFRRGGGSGGGFRGRNRFAPRGSTKRVQMLNVRRADYFRIDLRDALAAANLPPGIATGLAAAIFAKGSRQGIEVAKGFLEEKLTGGVISKELKDRIAGLLDQYAFWR